MYGDDEILQFIGKVVAYGGGAAAVAYGLFIFLGKRWIESIFSERLETFKHEQNKEIENVKYEINALLSRVTKIHEKEFEVLPELWGRMHKALALSGRFVSMFQQYPDIKNMTDKQLDDFLNQSRLHDFEKEELKKSSDKQKYYQDRIFFHDLDAVKKSFAEFHTYLERNRIFLSQDLKEQFTKIDDIIWESLVDREVGHGAGDHSMWVDAYKRIKNEVNPIKEHIESLVQQRLRYHKAE